MSSKLLRLAGLCAPVLLLLLIQLYTAGSTKAEVKGQTPTPTPGPVQIVPAFGGINYGTTTVGSPEDRDIWIYNNGSTTVTMLPPYLTDPTGFAIVFFGSSNISGHFNTHITVRLLATQRGSYSTQLVIRFSNYNNGFPYYISLGGQVTAPLIRVTDGQTTIAEGSQYNMGNTPYQVPKDQQFVIYNDGDAPLNLSLNLTGSGYFLIDGPVSTVPPNGNTPFTIRLLANDPGTFTLNVSISSNDSTHNPYTFSVIGTVASAPTPTPLPPPPAPRLSIVSGDGISIPYNGSYALPSTPACTATSRAFTINNDGNATLTISDLNVTGESWSVILDPPGSIPASSSGVFRIRLLSCTPGNKTGQVTITSNDPVHQIFRFTLTGTVTGPSVRVVSGDGITLATNGSYTFPATPAGTPVSRAFTIYNDGNTPLNISNMTVTGEGFSLILAPPTSIAAGSSGVFRVRLLSNTPGNKSGQVTFNTDDPSNNPFTFQVLGTVTP